MRDPFDKHTMSDLMGADLDPPAIYAVIDRDNAEPVRVFKLQPFRHGFDGFDFDPEQHLVMVYRAASLKPTPADWEGGF